MCFFSKPEAEAIGIIGGADGPTTIVIASKTTGWTDIMLLLGLLMVIGIILLRKGRAIYLFLRR